MTGGVARSKISLEIPGACDRCKDWRTWDNGMSIQGNFRGCLVWTFEWLDAVDGRPRCSRRSAKVNRLRDHNRKLVGRARYSSVAQPWHHWTRRHCCGLERWRGGHKAHGSDTPDRQPLQAERDPARPALHAAPGPGTCCSQLHASTHSHLWCGEGCWCGMEPRPAAAGA